MSADLYQALSDATVKLGDVYPIACGNADFDRLFWNDILSGDGAHESLSKFLRRVPMWAREDEDAFSEWAQNTSECGVILQAHTPDRVDFPTPTSAAYSWGLTRGTTIYARTLDEAVRIACAWGDAEERRQRAAFAADRAEAAK